MTPTSGISCENNCAIRLKVEYSDEQPDAVSDSGLTIQPIKDFKTTVQLDVKFSQRNRAFKVSNIKISKQVYLQNKKSPQCTVSVTSQDQDNSESL